MHNSFYVSMNVFKHNYLYRKCIAHYRRNIPLSKIEVYFSLFKKPQGDLKTEEKYVKSFFSFR